MDIDEDKKKKLYEVRAHNLAYILNSDFGGDIDSFSDAIGVKRETVARYFNPKSDRPCSDRTARKIESVLGKALHSLDFFFDEKREVYYIAIGTNAHYTYEIISALQNEIAVQECSAVFGDIDILIKVEVENSRFLDILLAKIARMPGVKRSQTYCSVKKLHWQRAQNERMNLPPKDEKLYFSKGLEEFIHRKMIHHFNEIRGLERGEISIKDEENINLGHSQIITGSQDTIRATKKPSEDVPNFDEYIRKEEELIKRGVQSQRIIFLAPDFMGDWNNIVNIYDKYVHIGCEVKFLMEEDWLSSPLSMFPEVFIIIDKDFVCVRRDDQGRVLIKRSPEMVHEYTNTFLANWGNALVFNDVVKRLTPSPSS